MRQIDAAKAIKELSTTYALKSHTHSYLPLSGGTISGSLAVSNDLNVVGAIRHNGTNIIRNNGTSTIISSKNGTLYLRPVGDTSTSGEVTISTSGVLNATNVTIGGNNVYHTGRKPSPADIGAATSSHAHSSTVISDVRDTNPTPNDCTDRAITTFFNNQYGDGWRSGVTVKGWSDGYTVWQLSNPSSTVISEQLKFRAGIGTTWNPWRKIYHEGNKPTPAEIGALPTSGGKISNTVANSFILERTGTDSNVNMAFKSPNFTKYLGIANGVLKFGDSADLEGTGKAIYHEGKKPTPAEIGTLNVKYALLGTATKFDIVPPDTDANFIRCTFSCGNKQEMSSIYVNVNGKYVTDWTVGGSFSMVVEFMKISASSYVMSMNVHCAMRNSDMSYRLTTSTNKLDYASIQKITFEHSQAGYKLENCAYTLEWY